MKKLKKSLLIGGMALLLGSSSSAQSTKKAPIRKTPKSEVKAKILSLKKQIGNYADRLIDERPTTTYDASKDFLAYPVKVNYTVDSLNFGNDYNAYFQEAIVVVFNRDEINNTPDGQQMFDQRLNPDLLHEMLHFIQKEKIKHLLSQEMAQNLTFEQAYELSVCKEVASHIGDKLAQEMNASKKFDFNKFVGIINKEAHRFLNNKNSLYSDQFFSEASHSFRPNSNPKNQDTFLKLKAAILSTYVIVDNQMKPVNLLPLLSQENLDLIHIPVEQLAKYTANQASIDQSAQTNNESFGKISEQQKIQLISARFRSYFKSSNKSVRSEPLNRDISAYFPKLSAEEYTHIETFCKQTDTAAHRKSLDKIIQAQNLAQASSQSDSHLYAER